MAAAHPKPFTGVFPIAPTPFTPGGEVDLDGQKRVLDCMVDQGVDGICILANYSEQFLLTDAERDALTDLCLSHVADRVPVIVTVSHFSTGIRQNFAVFAHDQGGQLLLLGNHDLKGATQDFGALTRQCGAPRDESFTGLLSRL